MAGLNDVSAAKWWDTCSCPGSESLRAEGRHQWPGGRPPDLDEVQRSVQEDREIRAQAQAAAAARSAGLSRAQLRDLYIDELHARGGETPPEIILEAEVDQVQAMLPPGAGTLAGFKMLGLSALRALKARRELARQPRVRQVLRGPRGEAPYVVLPDHSLPRTDVILDPDAASVVRALGPGLFVSLNQETPGDASVVVYADDRRVGTLAPDDVPRYQPALDAARRAGSVLMVSGDLTGGDDAVPRLQIYPAGVL